MSDEELSKLLDEYIDEYIRELKDLNDNCDPLWMFQDEEDMEANWPQD